MTHRFSPSLMLYRPFSCIFARIVSYESSRQIIRVYGSINFFQNHFFIFFCLSNISSTSHSSGSNERKTNPCLRDQDCSSFICSAKNSSSFHITIGPPITNHPYCPSPILRICRALHIWHLDHSEKRMILSLVASHALITICCHSFVCQREILSKWIDRRAKEVLS